MKKPYKMLKNFILAVGYAKRINIDHSLNTPEIMVKNNVKGCLLTTQYTNKYDYGVVHISARVPFDIGDIEVSINPISPIQFVEQSQNDESGLNFHEYGNTDRHSIAVGGEMDVIKDIVKGFLEDDNIEIIYANTIDKDVHLLLVLKEEVDEMALKLARLQNSVSRQYPQHTIEIMYIPSEQFTDDFIPIGSVPYPRG